MIEHAPDMSIEEFPAPDHDRGLRYILTDRQQRRDEKGESQN
jgi:hypothetical protein